VNYKAVRAAIAESLDDENWDDGSWGPVLIRLAWHSSGTYDKTDNSGGSQYGSMRFAPESEHGANAGLEKARDFLEPIKAQYPDITYADLYTLAGVVAVEEMGGPKIAWNHGRVDASDASKCTSDGRLPDGTKGSDHLRDIFYRMGFNDQEIVALAVSLRMN
jgi:cytochrome c peroxidase